jgi:hypothetical protein
MKQIRGLSRRQRPAKGAPPGQNRDDRNAEAIALKARRGVASPRCPGWAQGFTVLLPLPF